MKPSKANTEMALLRREMLEDLMAMSDQQLREEAMEDGDDIEALALQTKVTMRESAAKALRERLTLSRVSLKTRKSAYASGSAVPSLEKIKIIVHDLFQSDKNLGLAFREGKKQSDADWLSLYEDLLEMGLIEQDDDKRER